MSSQILDVVGVERIQIYLVFAPGLIRSPDFMGHVIIRRPQ